MRGVVGLGAELGVLVAVHLHQRALPGGDDGRAQGVGVVGEHLGEGADALREAGGERLVGQQLGPVGAQGGGARRLEPDDRDAGREPRLDRAQAAAQHAAGGVDLAGGGPGEPAADGARRQLDGVAEGLEHGDGVGGDGGVEVVGEGVGPEQQAGAAAGAVARPAVARRAVKATFRATS